MTHDLTCTLRVTAGDPDVARVAVRNEQFLVGRPLELDSASRRIAAIEYALGALAGEVLNGLRHFGWRRRVDIEHAEALVSGAVADGLAYLQVVGEGGRPRLGDVRISVFVAAPDEPAIRRLWSDVLERLPLLGTLRSAIPVHVELIVTP